MEESILKKSIPIELLKILTKGKHTKKISVEINLQVSFYNKF